MRLKSVFLAVATALVCSVSAHAASYCGDGHVDILLGEQCDVIGGSTCCIQCRWQPSTTVCRPAADVCDIEEHCTGLSETCPADTFKPTRTICRKSLGATQSAYESTRGPDTDTGAIGGSASGVFRFRVGSGPLQTLNVSSGTTVRQFVDGMSSLQDSAAAPDRVSASAYDAGMRCQADAPGNQVCRTDADCASGVTCRTTWHVYVSTEYAGSASALVIDQDDTGLGFVEARAALDDVCDTAEHCTGTSASCPADVFAPSSTTCRPSGGVCDVAEFCPGTAKSSCPFDTLVASGTECRASAGVCDPAEQCDGRRPECPVDAKATMICRASAGSCDPAESCDGASNDCPADTRGGAGQICRYAAGACDVAETCDGASLTCPPNAFRPLGTVCRASVDQCDADETCTGYAAACPIDRPKADGTPCDDGQYCTVYDACVAGVCGASPETCGDGILQNTCSEQCDDGNTADGDGCSSGCLAEPGLGCPFLPLTGCRQSVGAGKSTVSIRDEDKIGKLQFRWRWRKGSATTLAELGNPLVEAPAGTSYTLCVYDPVGLLVQATAPAGGMCGVLKPQPCWTPALGRDHGFWYRDPAQSIEPDGVARIDLTPGVDGKASIAFDGEGGLFPFPSNGGFGGLHDLSEIASPLLVQLQNSSGLCFETRYEAPFRLATPTRFLAVD